jgi:hypothetical protein
VAREVVLDAEAYGACGYGNRLVYGTSKMLSGDVDPLHGMNARATRD